VRSVTQSFSDIRTFKQIHANIHSNVVVCAAEVKAGPQEDRLLRRFFRENLYFPTSRPVANDSESVQVTFCVNQFKTFELVNLQLQHAVLSRMLSPLCGLIAKMPPWPHVLLVVMLLQLLPPQLLVYCYCYFQSGLTRRPNRPGSVTNTWSRCILVFHKWNNDVWTVMMSRETWYWWWNKYTSIL